MQFSNYISQCHKHQWSSEHCSTDDVIGLNFISSIDCNLKRKMERLNSKYVFAPAGKAANNVIII